jgi:putative membrane protein
VVTASYGIGFWRALLLAVALSVLSWLATAISGVPTFRAG